MSFLGPCAPGRRALATRVPSSTGWSQSSCSRSVWKDPWAKSLGLMLKFKFLKYFFYITGRRLHKGWWYRGQIHLRKRVQWWELCQEARQGIAQYRRRWSGLDGRYRHLSSFPPGWPPLNGKLWQEHQWLPVLHHCCPHPLAGWKACRIWRGGSNFQDSSRTGCHFNELPCNLIC